MGSVIVDESVVKRADYGASAIIVGQRVKDVIVVLHMASCASDVSEAEVHEEQLQRMLVGGLQVLGRFHSLPLKPAASHLLSASRDAADGRLLLSRAGKPVHYTVSDELSKLAFVSVALPVRVALKDASEPFGLQLEKRMQQLADAVRKHVVASVRLDVANRKATASLWCDVALPLSVGHDAASQPQGAAVLVAQGVVSGACCIHTSLCSAAEAEAFLVEDLSSACVVRAAVMLDELEALQEQSNPPLDDGPLARLHRVAVTPQACWTLPRRVVVRGGANGVGIRFCDWQLPEEYGGQQTIQRCSDVLGLNAQLGWIEDVGEAPPADPRFQVNGLAPKNASKKASPAAFVATKQASSSSGFPSTGLIGIFLVVLVALIAIIASRL